MKPPLSILDPQFKYTPSHATDIRVRFDRLRKAAGFKVPMPRLEVHDVFPPIPTNAYDYAATRDGYEPGCLIGRGPTKDAAIQDLLQQEYDNGK
jgi:hypothetical protein